MRNMRVIGMTIKKLLVSSNMSTQELARKVNMTETDMEMSIYGRKIFSFEQLETIARILGSSVDFIVAGDQQYYNTAIVDCMNEFKNEENREKLLDLIYDYVDIYDEAGTNKEKYV